MLSRTLYIPRLRSTLLGRFNVTDACLSSQHCYKSCDADNSMFSLNSRIKAPSLFYHKHILSLTQQRHYVTFNAHLKFLSRQSYNRSKNTNRYYARGTRVKKVFSDQERDQLLKSMQLEMPHEQIKPGTPRKKRNMRSNMTSPMTPKAPASSEANQPLTTKDEDRALSFYKYQSMFKEHALTEASGTSASPSELQPVRDSAAYVIAVPDKAGEPVYAPHERLYLDIKEMEPAQVLNTVQERHSEMDKLHFALCLKQLHNYYTKLNMADEKLGLQFGANLRKNALFKLLVAFVSSLARSYNAEVTYDMTCFLHDLGYSHDDSELQLFLQLSKHHVSELHLDQLLALAERVRDMPRDQLTDVLGEGLHLMISTHEKHLPSLYVGELCSVLSLYSATMTPRFLSATTTQLARKLSEFEDDCYPSDLLKLVEGLAACDNIYESNITRMLAKFVFLEAYRSLGEMDIDFCMQLLDSLARLNEKLIRKQAWFNSIACKAANQVLCGRPSVDKAWALQKCLWTHNILHIETLQYLIKSICERHYGGERLLSIMDMEEALLLCSMVKELGPESLVKLFEKASQSDFADVLTQFGEELITVKDRITHIHYVASLMKYISNSIHSQTEQTFVSGTVYYAPGLKHEQSVPLGPSIKGLTDSLREAFSEGTVYVSPKLQLQHPKGWRKALYTDIDYFVRTEKKDLIVIVLNKNDTFANYMRRVSCKAQLVGTILASSSQFESSRRALIIIPEYEWLSKKPFQQKSWLRLLADVPQCHGLLKFEPLTPPDWDAVEKDVQAFMKKHAPPEESLDGELFSEEYLQDMVDPHKDDERYAWRNRAQRMARETKL